MVLAPGTCRLRFADCLTATQPRARVPFAAFAACDQAAGYYTKDAKFECSRGCTSPPTIALSAWAQPNSADQLPTLVDHVPPCADSPRGNDGAAPVYFFLVRVAPPRPRSVTPDSESTR